jgi:DNA-binding SARP family transcriptional activator
VAILDLYEGCLALRYGANRRATTLLDAAAKQLEAAQRPQEAARALLLLAEASFRAGHVRQTEAALNHMETLVMRTDCAGYLEPVVPYAYRVLQQRRELRRLRSATRALLDLLARSQPGLSAPGDAVAGRANGEPLVLWPFGAGRAVRGRRDVPIASVPLKARELLFYLSLRGEPIPRANLPELLWPDRSAHADQWVWDATRCLRRLLGDSCFAQARRTLAFELQVEDMARRASELCAAALAKGAGANPEQQLALVEEGMVLFAEGPYLAWCDSAWAAVERNRLQAEAQRLGLLGAALHEQQGRYDDATRLCRQVIGFDQYDERGWTQLIRAALARGRAAEARAAYREYAALLQADLATRPPADLLRLVAEQGDDQKRR